eukprot:gene13547-16012_t
MFGGPQRDQVYSASLDGAPEIVLAEPNSLTKMGRPPKQHTDPDATQINVAALSDQKNRVTQALLSLSSAETVSAIDPDEVETGRSTFLNGILVEDEESIRIADRLKTVNFDAIRDGSDLMTNLEWFIDPRSPFRNHWDFFLIGFVMYNCVFIPYQMSFDAPSDTRLEVFELVIDSLFVLDILLNFFTGYFDSAGRLVGSKVEIRGNYLKTWFPVDLLASFPLEQCMYILGEEPSENTQIFALLKFPRLLRLGRLLKYMNKLKGANMLIAMRIFQLVLLVCLICHWMACLWHMACSATDDCSSSYDDLRAVDVYLQAYYTATLALMGDHIYVDSRAQQIMVICLTLFGSFMLAVVFGSVANMVNQLNLKEVYHQSKVDSLNDVMRYLDLPKNIQERIRQHQEYAWMRYRDVEGGIEGFAKPLPESLQQEVLLNFHTTVLNKVTFFVALPQNAQIALVSKLTSKTAIPGEGATVLATTFCDMHHLSRESFSSLVVDFPEILHGLQSYHKHEIDP